MIQAEVRGSLPDAQPVDFSKTMDVVGKYMLDSVRQNFIRGGRPEPWQPLAKGGPSFLFQTGTLMRSIYETSGPTWAQIQTAGLPYAAIHQFGGWAGRGHKSNIPSRPYMLFQKEDYDFIRNLFKDQLVLFVNAKKDIKQ